ncbi:hypothetical protein SMALB_2021 [Streptomyces malaysiensis]|uniref:Uncharacterized protein n=1 Tax=Streptomyces malaysiensis TaxID=92644 RepID=A0A7X6AVM7_STRMQ|nr:hypothetical protein [Streptomyces malaysiensis]
MGGDSPPHHPARPASPRRHPHRRHPLTIVPKTLRHSALSTTANIYSHLTHQAAHDDANAIDQTLTQADHDTPHRHWLTHNQPSKGVHLLRLLRPESPGS